MPKTSGQAPFVFSLCEDLYTLPEAARACEVDLHGGFAVDPSPGGHIYYGMPGCGLMSITPDLSSQEIIELPSDLKPVNFHGTTLIEFDGKRRLVLPANDDEKVVVVSLDGNVDYVLARPEFDEYQDAETPYKPTDTAFADGTLYVADGYGANYISTVDPAEGSWQGIFAGRTDDPTAEGLFGTAHGLGAHPDGHHLSIADRPHAAFSTSATAATSTRRTAFRTTPSRVASTSCSAATTGTPWWAASTIPRRGGRRPSTSWTPTPMPWCPPSGRRKIWAWSWPTTSTTRCGTNTATSST